MLIQVETIRRDARRRAISRYVCHCGNFIDAREDHVKRGRIYTCGCLKTGAHGMAGTPTYLSWQHMKQRCFNPKNQSYANYGGRGITVCDRWLKFENFYADMGVRPDGMSLERKENNGDYEPNNCRWATQQEQTCNTRRTRRVEWNGRIQTMTAWAVELGLRPNCVIKRLGYLGWTMERALGLPGAVEVE